MGQEIATKTYNRAAGISRVSQSDPIMCVCVCVCLRLGVSHKHTHLSVRSDNEVISRRQELVTHAQTQLASVKAKEGVIKMEGRFAEE